VSPAQRAALIVRDRGCAVPGCVRPPPWCEAHHLRHVRREALEIRTEVKDHRRWVVAAAQ
jgi:hypothetical protein